MESRKQITTLTLEDFKKMRYSDKFGLRKKDVLKIIHNKRFKDFQTPSIYQIDPTKLNVPEQFFTVENIAENFNFLVELLCSDSIDVIKFVAVTIRQLTLSNIDFDSTLSMHWVESLFKTMSQHLEHPDLIVRFLFNLCLSMSLYGSSLIILQK
ncbi:MAG: hypothetical protein MJ252_29930 [archaeon]|nr:hypothetical protein [archaeon]